MGAKRWLLALVVPGFLLISAISVFPQNWTLTSAPDTNWSSIACSADGRKVIASANGGFVYVSTNSGSDWSPAAVPVATWASVASSANGDKLMAVPHIGYIHLSTNSGVTWVATGSFLSNGVISSACSADGSKLFIFPGPYISTNSGLTWRTSPANYQQRIACSADGTKLITAAPGNSMLLSRDHGQSWLDTGTISCSSVASSAEGHRLMTGNCGSSIQVSSDAGISWQPISFPGPPFLSLIACSTTGEKLLSATDSYWDAGSIYSSTNAGSSWISNSLAPAHWTCIALSADGCRIFAASAGGRIWTAKTASVPILNIRKQETSARIAWILPAEHFVLQENADLNPANWTDVTTQPVLNLTNLHHEVSMPLSSTNRFFRLKSL